MPAKLLVVGLVGFLVGLCTFFCFLIQQMKGRQKPSLISHLFLAALSLGSLMTLEIVDLFFIRRWIPLDSARFLPFVLFSFRYGTIAVACLGTFAWLLDWVSWSWSENLGRLCEQSKVRVREWDKMIGFSLLFITLGFLFFLLWGYCVKHQWWLEKPLPFIIYIPVVLGGIALLKAGKKTLSEKILLVSVLWFFCFGYFITTQLMERFHNTTLRLGVIMIVVLALTGLFRILIPPTNLLIPKTVRLIALTLWGLLFTGTLQLPLTNQIILDAFTRSHYLYLATLLFQPAPKLDFIHKEKPQRDLAEITVSKNAKPNILLITSEALRGDLFDGKHSKDMPEVAKLASQGSFFANHHSATPVTLTSFYSIMTGRYHEKVVPLKDAFSFFEIAKKAGYRTETLQPFVKIEKFPGMTGMIDKIYQIELNQRQLLSFYSSSDMITQKTKEILTSLNSSPEPYLLWIHYVDPHMVYNDSKDPMGSRLALTRERSKQKYLVEVSNVDRNIGELVNFIQSSLSKQPKIIITADHGEEFLDHYDRMHATYLYEESMRVPFLILDPEFKTPHVVKDLTSHVDIFPTFLEWMGVEIKHYPLSGHSLAAVPKGEALSLRDTLFMVSDTRKFVGMIEENKKIIQYCFHLKFPAIEWFDLEADPGERFNLADTQKKETERLEAKIHDWMLEK